MVVLETIFIIVLFLMLHTYFLYPISIYLICQLKGKATHGSVEKYSTVSILIAAYNEEKVIRERIENLSEARKEFQYFEVLVGSDNSSDSTNDILIELSKKYEWLKFYNFQVRNGKAGILNKLYQEAKGEILVFTDANTVFQRDALSVLLRGFRDLTVGGVCGRLILNDDRVQINEPLEERRYWRYETQIKQMEGKLGILIGANGGIFAIKKDLFQEIPVNRPVTDDLFLTLNVLSKGYKFIYERDAIAFEDVGQNVQTEFKRKVRFSATNFQTIAFFKDFLFFRPALVSYAFLSHKVIRWFFPFLAIFLFILTVLIAREKILYQYFLYTQILFFVLAFLGYLMTKLKKKLTIFSIPFFFIMANTAIILGLAKYISNSHSVIWESTKR